MQKLYFTLVHGLSDRLAQVRRSIVYGMLLIIAVIAGVACGGGGSVASVGSGGTGTLSASTFSVGTITGFGSVFVNGTRFEDTNASVSDEDGARSRNDLKLGMVVKVQGSVNASGTATASSFSFDSELQGRSALSTRLAKPSRSSASVCWWTAARCLTTRCRWVLQAFKPAKCWKYTVF